MKEISLSSARNLRLPQTYCTWLTYDAAEDGWTAQHLQGLIVTFLTETAGWNVTAVSSPVV